MTVHHDHRTAPMTRRIAALERLLAQRGAITEEQVDDVIDAFTRRLGAHHGARYVARAWSDAAFRDALLEDATGVVRGHGYDLRGATNLELPFLRLVAVANTPAVHNLIVCTLCSCYPIPLLGPQPRWYKSNEYRARAVREPRAVLAEFGVQLRPEVRVEVWDSTADCRYIVVPERPPGTDGLTEDELAALVTRNCLIGTELPHGPAAHAG